MSWLARSLANSLKLDDQQEESSSPPVESDSPRGVKEDLSELTKTLTRQFWGVASFLAPPPSSDPSESPPIAADPSEPPSVSEQSDDLDSGGFAPKISGIRSDFAEIGGRFRTGISRLSSNKAVTEISKIASTFLPFGSEESEDVDLEGAAVGVTEEVLAFARNISMHPETWMDFPLFAEDEYSDDFDMSDAQQEHALAVERLAPRLAALRIELCPSHMSEECFWKIYFVLLHSRLNKHDADMLSTPQIVEARAMLLQELQSRTKSVESDKFSGLGTSNTKDSPDELHEANDTLLETAPVQTFAFEPTLSQSPRELETDKHPVEAVDNKFVDKSVIEEGPAIFNSNKELSPTSSKVLEQKFDEDGDDWLDEENTEMSGPTIPLGNEEDVSFSDLEDDEDGSAAMSARTVTDTSDSSKGSRGWVELRKSPGEMAKKDSRLGSPGEKKESNDWLNVEDIDTV